MISPTMIDAGALFRSLLFVIAASLLPGCISVFPKSEPAQLYRFGTTAPQVQNTTTAEPAFNVVLGDTGFEHAAAGDRILTVTGTQAAYIKDARWVTSSKQLFDSALHHAFDADPGPARLVGSGAIGRTDYLLTLDVRTFEARYHNGQDSAPEIAVEVRAILESTQDQTAAADRVFKTSITASDNRVSAITEAFDQAVSQVLGNLVAWVDARAQQPGALHASQ
jgi:cholesterol transport system auxiliary component